MWKCFNCETINDKTDVCVVCGQPRPVVKSPATPPVYTTTTPTPTTPPPAYVMPEQKKSYMPAVIGVLVGIILALLIVIGILLVERNELMADAGEVMNGAEEFASYTDYESHLKENIYVAVS